MSDNHENDLGDIRYAFMHVGEVYDRNDPKGIGRVRVRVPGFMDNPASPWALPLGAPGGGAKQRGMKFTPALHAEVALFFKGGDPDAPYFLPAQWGAPGGASEMPTDCKDAPIDEMADINCVETDRWKITLDDRVGKERLVLEDKKTGDLIEMDGTTATGPGILIKATQLVVQVDGAFIVQAARVVFNDRKLADGSQSI